MRRMLASLVGLLVAWMGLALPAAAVAEAPSPAPLAAYTYDSQQHAAPTADTASERGPPASYDHTITSYGPDGLRPLGSSARLEGPQRPTTSHYDHLARFVQATRASHAAGEPVGSAGSGSSTIQRPDVAANTAPKALNASSRVAPWAGTSLSRLSREGEVMYRVYGGGAGKAGSWLTPINPVSSAAARQGLALPAENAALYVSRVTLPGGVRPQVGTAGSAFRQPGGWAQAQLLERIPLSSFGKGVPLQ